MMPTCNTITQTRYALEMQLTWDWNNSWQN